jgi:hypothetical protein
MLTLGKGAGVKGGRAIVNFGSIEGEEYTLQSALIRNEDKDRKKATIKATKTLTLEGQKLEHKGALAASSLRLAVDEIEDSTSSTIKADRLTTVLKKSWDAQGTIDIDRWQDTSAETVVIQNQGKIITRQQASLAAQLRNLKEGKVDLTGVELRNSREQSQPFVNEGEMVLRKVESLGGARRNREPSRG